MSNFNYYSLVWNFSSTQPSNKIENLQKRALRFLLNDYDSTYEDRLEKFGRPNMNLRRQRTLCREILKTLNTLNPRYMNDIFKLRNRARQKNGKKQAKLGNYKLKTYT